MSLFREIADFYRFFRKTPEAEREIVFYAEHEGYYPNFEGIINELLNRHRKKICYITSDPHDPIFKKSNPMILPFYSKKLLPFFVSIIRCKVFIMTLPDLNQLHLRRSVNPVHYVYVFHSLVSTHMMYYKGAFDYYDSILCCSPYQIEEIRKHEEINKLPSKSLIQAGYYRLERIYDKYKKYLEEKSSVMKKITVLVAPSWGVKNILESCGERLVDLLLKNDYNVIVRPHPETVKRSRRLINKLSKKFGNSPGFILERSVRTDNSLLKADILICDCSGVAIEYAFGTERPVLFLDVPYKIRNKNFKELNIEPFELSIRSKIGIVIPPEKLDIVPQTIKKLIANQQDFKDIIVELRKQSVYAFGHSSEIGSRHIADLCDE